MAKKLFITKKFKIFCKLLDSPLTGAIIIHLQGEKNVKNLPKAYAFALNYVKEKGYDISGPIREVYIHGCWDSNNEDNYLTEIQIPIKK